MAALLRQGARRIGGSVLQRTQAAVTSPAVAEERRRLVPRRMLSTEKSASEEDLRQKKEALYEVLSKADNLRNKGLLKDLAVHVEPRPRDSQWRRLRSLRKMNYFAEAGGTYFIFSCVVWFMDVRASYAAAEKQVKMESEDQVETLME